MLKFRLEASTTLVDYMGRQRCAESIKEFGDLMSRTLAVYRARSGVNDYEDAEIDDILDLYEDTWCLTPAYAAYGEEIHLACYFLEGNPKVLYVCLDVYLSAKHIADVDKHYNLLDYYSVAN